MFLKHAFAVIVLATTSLSAQANFFEYQLKNLRNSNQTDSILNTNKVGAIAMIFQPDCPWCKKQSATMAQLQKKCGNILNISVIGTKGSTMQLKRELRHFDDSLNAFSADTTFLRLAGGFQASPTTLFFDQKGELLLKQRGYINPEKLNAAAQAISGNICNATAKIY